MRGMDGMCADRRIRMPRAGGDTPPDGAGSDPRTAGDLALAERPKLRRPRRYQVVMLNDDYTPMPFVVWVLMQVFHHSRELSERLMWQVHTEGQAVVGRYSLDVARTKAARVHEAAEREGHPLRCELEVEEG